MYMISYYHMRYIFIYFYFVFIMTLTDVPTLYETYIERFNMTVSRLTRLGHLLG